MTPEDDIFRDDEGGPQDAIGPLRFAVGASWKLAFDALIAAQSRRTPAEALRQSEDWMQVAALEARPVPKKVA